MQALKILRSVVWASAAAGVFIAFAWPFAISDDPTAPALKHAGIAVAVVFFLSLAAASCVAAALRREPGGR